jgi:hypothetical protein
MDNMSFDFLKQALRWIAAQSRLRNAHVRSMTAIARSAATTRRIAASAFGFSSL